jgi:hypothetical protein
MKKKGQQARKKRKLAQLDDDGNFFFLFWLGDKSIFVRLSGTGAHGIYLARSCLWMASDFAT